MASHVVEVGIQQGHASQQLWQSQNRLSQPWGFLCPEKKSDKSAVHRPQEGTRDLDSKGLQMIKQPGHNVHFNYATSSKPGEQSLLPGLKVFFDGHQKGRKIAWENVFNLTWQKDAQVFDVCSCPI